MVERAKAEGKLRADAEPWDVPGLICGIGRAVRAAPGVPALTWQRHLEIILAGLARKRTINPSTRASARDTYASASLPRRGRCCGSRG